MDVMVAGAAYLRFPELLETVEDQTQPELELAAPIVLAVGRFDVLFHVLHEVGILVERELLPELRAGVRKRSDPGRITRLPHRESDDVAVERVIGVVGHLGREASLPESSEQRLHIAESRWTDPGRRHHEVASPGMAQEDLMCRDGAPAEGRLPVAVLGGTLDLADDKIQDAIEDVVLVGQVVVKRHRLDAKPLRELAHRERLDPARIGDLQGGA